MVLRKVVLVSTLFMSTVLLVSPLSAQEVTEEVPTGFELYEEHFNAGKLSEKGYLFEGKPVGEWHRWHENGQLSMEAWFTTEGVPAGTWIYYDESGKKEKEEIYENGELAKTVNY